MGRSPAGAEHDSQRQGLVTRLTDSPGQHQVLCPSKTPAGVKRRWGQRQDTVQSEVHLVKASETRYLQHSSEETRLETRLRTGTTVTDLARTDGLGLSYHAAHCPASKGWLGVPGEPGQGQ